MLKKGVFLLSACLASLALGQGRPDILNYIGGHRGAINAIAVSEDNTRVATAQVGGPTNIFDAGTGQLVMAIPGDAKQLAYTPDSQKLIARDSTGFTVYNAINGASLLRVQIDNPSSFVINAGAISADGTRAAGLVSNNSAVVWNLNTGVTERTFPASGINACSASLNADNKTLAVGTTAGHIISYNCTDGSVVGDFAAHSGSVMTLSFSGSTILSGGADHLVKMWSAQGGTFIRQFTGHSGTVYTARMSDNGQYVISGAANGQLYLWNANTGGIICGFWNHQGNVRAVDFTPNGADIVAGDDYMNVNHWRINGLILIRNYTNHKGEVNEVAISPDGRTVASGGADGKLRLWRNSAIYRTISFGPSINGLSFSPNSLYVAASGSVITTVYDVNSGNQVGMIAHSGVAMNNAFAQDSQTLYSCCTGFELKRFTPSGSVLWTVDLSGPVHYIAVPDNGNFVAAAALIFNGSQYWTNIHIVNIANGSTFLSWTAYSGAIRGMSFTPDGKLITQFADGTVRAWNPTTGAMLWSRSGTPGRLSLATNAHGDVMLGGDSGNLRFYRLSDGNQLRSYNSELDTVNSVAISRDERWYAYGLATGTFATAKNPFASDVVSATLARGITLSGGPQSLSMADQNYWLLRPGPVLSATEAPVQVILNGTAAAETASRFTFNIVVGTNSDVLEENLYLFDYQANTWQLVYSGACFTSDHPITIDQTNNMSRFIQPGTRELRAKMTWKAFAPVLSYPWHSWIDQAYWVVVP